MVHLKLAPKNSTLIRSMFKYKVFNLSTSYIKVCYLSQHGNKKVLNPPLAPPHRFIQLAENSSRQAFQSIESIVHAFGSVSMMLESTYHALYRQVPFKYHYCYHHTESLMTT